MRSSSCQWMKDLMPSNIYQRRCEQRIFKDIRTLIFSRPSIWKLKRNSSILQVSFAQFISKSVSLGVSTNKRVSKRIESTLGSINDLLFLTFLWLEYQHRVIREINNLNSFNSQTFWIPPRYKYIYLGNLCARPISWIFRFRLSNTGCCLCWYCTRWTFLERT